MVETLVKASVEVQAAGGRPGESGLQVDRVVTGAPPREDVQLGEAIVGPSKGAQAGRRAQAALNLWKWSSWSPAIQVNRQPVF